MDRERIHLEILYQKQRPISALSYSIRFLAHPRKFKVSKFYITPKADVIMAIVAQVSNVALGLLVFLTLLIISFFQYKKQQKIVIFNA